MTTHSSLTSTEVSASLELVEVKPGLRFSKATLQAMLPDTESCLFFGKVYDLNAQQLGQLLLKVLNSDLAHALFGEDHVHSHDLQGYISDGYYDEDDNWHQGITAQANLVNQDLEFDADDYVAPKGEILPEVWKQLEVEVATSIKAVAAKLESVVARLPGKTGEMAFKSMMTMNKQRPAVLGTHQAHIHHARQQENLVILDVSGSMNESTVRRIIDDVVALSYEANAHMAIVSNDTFYWTPGSYSVEDVLAKAQYGGTCYQTLASLFDRDWGVVVCIADFDSYVDARDVIRARSGHIDQVLDISLVNRPTWLSECVGQLADEVKPLLIATSTYVLSN